MEIKKLPIGIQTFSDIIEQNYLYIDKTKDIYNLISKGGKYFFISRPRRFGKSLLISTLYELFSGNRDLFKDLWIYDKIDWKKHPVVHIDFTDLEYETDSLLKKSIEETLQRIADEKNIQLTTISYKTKFSELIKKLSSSGKVVILIDEYDKPIIDFIQEKETAFANRKVLKNFYSVLKSSDKYVHFVFLTGVSKFSRVSVFSGLNNLNDITIDDRFSTLLGCTRDELLIYFNDRIDDLSRKMSIDKEELLKQMEKWYNGYSWDGSNFLYNPLSLLNLFSKNRFGNFWFSTGTPTFLVNHIKNREKDISSLERVEVDESIFESYDIENLGILSMLFQTGYLTIKEIKPVGIRAKYILSYPNEEVKESFLKHFLASYSSDEPGTIGSKILDLGDCIREHNIEKFFTIIKSIFAAIPSHIFIKEREAYYHTVIYLILELLGMIVQAEVHTNKGRIDAVVETSTDIYLLEFKLGTSGDALSQIEKMKYYERYFSSGKAIHLIGVGFNIKEKNIADYEIKRVASASS
ncbi:MAG: ATP-binding protein [Candidatus Aminicenantes bacterium]|nr:ATP-binding protein [Candidatus Aminicenantes bacterium]